MAHIDEDHLDGLLQEVESIIDALGTQHVVGSARDELLNNGRRIIASIDSMPTVLEPQIEQKQLDLIEAVQRLAYYDPDSGGVKDIAEWCMQKWLSILQRDPEHWQVLKGNTSLPLEISSVPVSTHSGPRAGLGHAWLLKSQVSLAKIHTKEESVPPTMDWPRPHSRDRHVMDDDNVLNGADYVEARGTLLPSTEYFARAVRAAEKKNELTGDLLVLVSP